MRRRVAFLGAGLLMVLALAAPASAVQLESHDCEDVILESFVLDGDVGGTTPCPTDGLVIGASGITVDLNGNTIWGNGTGPGWGIRNEGFEKVTIRNGAIRGFEFGIGVGPFIPGSSTDGTRIERVVALQVSQRGISITGDKVVIEDSVILTTGGDGINVHGAKARVEGNVVSESASEGIEVQGDLAKVEDNTSIHNADNGIEVWNGTGQRIYGNAVASNDSHGLLVSGGDALVTENVASDNVQDGIQVTGDGARVLENVSSGNDFGMLLGGTDVSIVAEGNVVSGNKLDGLHITDGTISLAGNILNGNGFGTPDGFGQGLSVIGGATVTGTSRALGNDDEAECTPANLCPAPEPSDLPPSSPGCGDPISSSIRLTADVGTEVLPCTGHGLIVTAEDVTIDMAGHTIWGNHDATGVPGVFDSGIFSNNLNGTTVLNGATRGFETGVHQRNPVDVGGFVSGVSAVDNQVEGVRSEGVGSHIESVTAAGNTMLGMLLNGRGLVLTSNVVSLGANDGVFISGGEKAKIVGNTIAANGGPGTENFGLNVMVPKLTLKANNILSNGEDGALIVSQPNAKVTNNVVVANGRDGLFADNIPGSTLKGNRFTGNGHDGLSLDDTDGVTIQKNTAAVNGRNGMLITPVTTAKIKSNDAPANGYDDAAPGAGKGIDASLVAATVAGSDNFGPGNDGGCADPSFLCA